jgi:hypothetical protein
VSTRRCIWVLKPYPEFGVRVESCLVFYNRKDRKTTIAVLSIFRFRPGEGKYKCDNLITDEHR